MRIAKQIGMDSNPCYSRQIGCVITDNEGSCLGFGYNGPPRGTYHTDSYEYIKDFLIPQLSKEEKDKLASVAYNKPCEYSNFDELIVPSKIAGCKTCPRKLLGYKSGERLGLCTCVHAEENAIVLARRSVKDGILFCWSPVSCVPCTRTIIQSGIKECHFLKNIYDPSSLVLYKFANIPIFLYSEDELNESLH